MNGWAFNDRINIVLLILTVLSLLSYLYLDIPQELYVLVHILTFGYLHGATDRVIFFADEKQTRLKFQLLFLGVYISIIAVSLLLWSFLPVIMLLLFLAYSSYHFGETHLEQSTLANRYRKAIHFLWGLLVLLGILLVRTPEVLEILEMQKLSVNIDACILAGKICFAFNAALILLLGIVQGKLLSAFIESQILLVYFFAATTAPVMVSFTLFFVYWHSSKSLVHQYLYLKKLGGTELVRKGGVEMFITGILPLLLMIIVWTISPLSLDQLGEWKEWIIALAASLSLPHVVLHAYKIYAQKRIA